MKKINLLIPTILVAPTIPLIGMVGCGENVIPTRIDIRGIHIESYEANVPAKGEEIQLGYEFTPSSYKGAVEWTCENFGDVEVATIDSTGKLSVSDENTGSAKITVKAVGYDDVFDLFWLNVNSYINITGGPDDHKVDLGRSFNLTAEVEPTDGNILWEVYGNEVTLKPDGNTCEVTGVNAGHGTIKAEFEDDPTVVYAIYIITVIGI